MAASPEGRGRLLGMYLGGRLFFAFVGSAAAGAAVNHYIETAFALGGAGPSGVAAMRHDWNGQPGAECVCRA